MARSIVAWLILLLCGMFTVQSLQAQVADPALGDQAVATLKKAAAHYRDKVASHGGYAYYYSVDLTQRWGEGQVSADTIFVQPPGTPSVGMAYLDAFDATGDIFYLDAACETADALVYGQLQSGGWTQAIHFAAPERGRLGRYRKRVGGKWNNSSLDDGQTQAALQFLIEADEALQFKDVEIHESVMYGLDALLKAQFPNGAFPQVWSGAVQAKPVRKAQFPSYDWKTEGRGTDYWDYYTLNDGLAGSVSDVLLLADRVYGDEKYATALAKLGDFLILAQMPDPQPAHFEELARAYIAVKEGKLIESTQPIVALEDDVRRIIGELDQQGRWVTPYAGERLVGQPKFARGFQYISSDVFNRNVQALSEFIRRLRISPQP